MSRYTPDLSTMTGILADIAPRPDDRAERDQVKHLTEDLDWEFGERTPVTFGGDGKHPVTTVGRAEHARQAVAGMQSGRAEVPVPTASPAG